MISCGEVDDLFEFGEWKKQNLINLCQLTCFSELVKISGLAHGAGGMERQRGASFEDRYGKVK